MCDFLHLENISQSLHSVNSHVYFMITYMKLAQIEVEKGLFDTVPNNYYESFVFDPFCK